MVSYYNPLSPAMFPNPPQMGVARHTTTPSAASAASVAAGHAYFQANYHAHVAAAAYGAHSHPAAHQYPGGYSAANLAADLNSNMYNGAGQNGQFMADNNWSSAASQWPAFGHPPISSSTSAAGSTACRFENWPQQQQQQQQQNNNEDSPPTPNNNDTAGLPAASGGRSPGNNYAQSHSSGSPSATPTPAGVSSATAQSYQPDMFNNKFTPNFGGHSPNGPMQNLESSSPLNSHMGSGELNPMASPVSLASPSSRPQPARSPYEWMKKPSYQSQPEKQGSFVKGGTAHEEAEILRRTRTKDKYRVVYSDHQRLELEKEFHYSRYITIRRKAELANSVGLSERQVKIWFQNRRAKERRALKKTEEAIVKDKLDPTTSATMAAAAAHAAAAANFVPFHSDSFHPPPSSLEFGSPPPPQPPTFHHHHHHGTTPMKFE